MLSQRRHDSRVMKHRMLRCLPGLPISQRKSIGSAKQNYCFFAEVIVLVAKSSQFKEYLAKNTEIFKFTTS
jgi:hypothetical protein